MSLSETILQSMGEASMCWNPTPTGEFDSTKAAEVGEKVIKDVRQMIRDVIITCPASPELDRIQNKFEELLVS